MGSKGKPEGSRDIGKVLGSNEAILGVCAALLEDARLDSEERKLLKTAAAMDGSVVADVVARVEAGSDPLGDAFMAVNRADERRGSGSVYTPIDLVGSMLEWSASNIVPARVVDCGCGSGRFAVAAARMYPDAKVVAVDVSPMATLMCKAHAAAAGIDVTVVRKNFTEARISYSDAGPTLWIGNPPYVRHHDLNPNQKEWYSATLSKLKLKGSTLAGLHAHFTASIAKRFRKGDVGCLVLSAEWMDVRYGSAMREVLTRKVPMRYMRTFDKTSALFDGTMSSAVVIGFASSSDGVVNVNGDDVPLSAFAGSDKWSNVIDGKDEQPVPDGFVRLGDIARVHRGVVTGRNGFWVRKPGEVSETLCVPVVSHARELAGNVPACRDVTTLSRLVTLPEDLADLPDGLREEAEGIVAEGLRQEVEKGYVAKSRRRWWSITPPKPPAILMTYMARHAPVFVVNEDGLGMLNVVHGIYPNDGLSEKAIERLADYLNSNVQVQDGRMYSGGLAKFEPREVERIVVPCVKTLEEG